MKFNKKTAFVTGGSSGIGQATSRWLQNEGFNVLAPGSKEFDVKVNRNWKELFRTKDIDLVVNCAGICVPEEGPPEVSMYDEHMDVNFFPSLFCYDHADKDHTTIINIGSTAAVRPKATWGPYNVSKAAVVSLTSTFKDQGWKTACVSPGRTNTPMRNKLFPNEDRRTLLSPEDVAFKISSVYSCIESGVWESHYIIEKG